MNTRLKLYCRMKSECTFGVVQVNDQQNLRCLFFKVSISYHGIAISIHVCLKFHRFYDINTRFRYNNSKVVQYVSEKMAKDKIEGALGFEPRT